MNPNNICYLREFCSFSIDNCEHEISLTVQDERKEFNALWVFVLFDSDEDRHV